MRNRLRRYNTAAWVKWLREVRLISKEEVSRIAQNARRKIREGEDRGDRDGAGGG